LSEWQYESLSRLCSHTSTIILGICKLYTRTGSKVRQNSVVSALKVDDTVVGATGRGKLVDALLVVIAVAALSVALWIWIAAAPIEREVVFLATTIALVIALVLVVNVVILMIFRLQKRISHLEGEISQNDAPLQETPEEQVIVVTLTNTERRIINRLEESEGRLTQDELRRATGLSKSTLSVTLTTLERKSLVEREISGRTKIVTLKRRVSR